MTEKEIDIPEVPREIKTAHEEIRYKRNSEEKQIRQLQEKIIEKQEKWIDTLQKAEKLKKLIPETPTEDDPQETEDEESFLTSEVTSLASDTSSEDFMDEEALRQAYREQKQESAALRENLEKIVNQVTTYKEDVENQNEELSEQIVILKNKNSEYEKNIKLLDEENMEIAKEFEEAKQEFETQVQEIQEEHRKQLQARIESLKEIIDEVEYIQQSNDELTQQIHTKDEELQNLREKTNKQEEEILELKIKIKKMEETGPSVSSISSQNLNISLRSIPADQRFLQISALLEKALKLSATPNNQNSTDLDSSFSLTSIEDIREQLEREKKAHQRDLEVLAQEKKRNAEEREFNGVLTTRSRELAIKLNLSESRIFSDQQIIRENHNFLGFIRSSIESILSKWPQDWSTLHKFATEVKHIADQPHSSKKGIFSSAFDKFDKRGSLLSSKNLEFPTEPQNFSEEVFHFEDEFKKQNLSLSNLSQNIEEHLSLQIKQLEQLSKAPIHESGASKTAVLIKKAFSQRRDSYTPSTSNSAYEKTKTLSQTFLDLSNNEPSEPERKNPLQKKNTISKATWRLLQMKEQKPPSIDSNLDDEFWTTNVAKKLASELKVETKEFNKKTFYSCFDSRSAINWMLKKLTEVPTREAATSVGQKILTLQIFKPCDPSTTQFLDIDHQYFYFPKKETQLQKQTLGAKALQEMFIKSGAQNNKPDEEKWNENETGTLRTLKKTSKFRAPFVDKAFEKPLEFLDSPCEPKKAQSTSSSKKAQSTSSSKKEQLTSSSKKAQLTSSSKKEQPTSSSKKEQPTSSSKKEQPTSSKKEKKDLPPKRETPTIERASTSVGGKASIFGLFKNPDDKSPKPNANDRTSKEIQDKRSSTKFPSLRAFTNSASSTISSGNNTISSGSSSNPSSKSITVSNPPSSSINNNNKSIETKVTVIDKKKKPSPKSSPKEAKRSVNKKELVKKDSAYKTACDMFVDPVTCFCSMSVVGFEFVEEKNKNIVLFRMDIQFHETKWQILRDYPKIYQCAKWIKYEKKLLSPQKYAKKQYESVSFEELGKLNTLFKVVAENRAEIFKKYKRDFLHFVVPIGFYDQKPEGYLVPFSLDIG